MGHSDLNLTAWCTHTRDAFRDWEDHEMAMYPSAADRDLDIVEWVVRVLGNPELPESRAAVEQLLARHGDTAAAEIDLSAARTDYEAYRTARDDGDGLEDYVAAAEAAANRVPALADEVDRLRVALRLSHVEIIRRCMALDDARQERDQARVEHRQAFESRERYREEVHQLRERLADAEHERELLREQGRDLDERYQLALRSEGVVRRDHNVALRLLDEATVERDRARAELTRARNERNQAQHYLDRWRDQARKLHVEGVAARGDALDAVDTVAALTGTDGETTPNDRPEGT